VTAACDDVGVDEFLLWTVHWTDPDAVPDDVRPVGFGTVARAAKRAALAGYRTQVEPLAQHLQAVLPATVVGWSHE
jgi:hypothetical protein